MISSFARDRRGNFALMTSVIMVPLILGAGLALDVANIARHRSQLQNATDAAVLAIAREGKYVSDKQAEAIARQFLGGNFDLDVKDVQIVRNGTEIQLKVRTDTDMAFGSMFGYDEWPIIAASSADLAYAKYEIGLVLDTTGSMAGGKMAAMKDAVHNLVESMAAEIKDKDKLKFALVPFSSFVNVGNAFGPTFDKNGKQVAGSGAPWLDLDGMSPQPQVELPVGLSRFQLYKHLSQPWRGCVETRIAAGGVDYGVTDLAADPSKPESLFVPAFAIDEEDSGYGNSYLAGNVKTLSTGVGNLARKMKKYGVPVDGNGKALAYGKTTTSNPAGLTSWTPVSVDTSMSSYSIPKGPNFLCLSDPVVPLTNDYPKIIKSVDALKAQGNTNILEGVAWGMRVLSPQAPFTEGRDKTEAGVEKMMIVLTDGANTMGTNNTALGSIYSSYGYLIDGRLGISSGGATATNLRMNAKTLEACDAAKAAGVEVYTIRLEEPDVKTGTMLKDCASSPENYFDVPTRSKLDEAFSKIREKMIRLRIAS